MPAVIRLGDTSTGHGCFPPTTLVSTSVTKTFFNGILGGVLTSSTQYATHCCGIVCHSGAERSPSSSAAKTYIEGNLAVRIGDSITCGDACGQGSPNTFIE